MLNYFQQCVDRTMNALNMEFEDETFQVAIDKATLDSMMVLTNIRFN